jgi:parafibromin
MASAEAALAALRLNSKSISLNNLSDKSVKLSGESFPFHTKCTFTAAGKTLTYSLISLFLLVHDPKQKLLKYKQLCTKYEVEDSVKILDKNAILEYLLGGADAAEEGRIEERERHADKPDASAKDEAERERSSAKKEKHKSRKRSSRDDEKTPGSSSKKKEKTAITQQDIMKNLNIVVDKRGGKKAAPKPDGGEVDVEMVVDASETNNEDDKATGLDEPPTLLSQEEEERKAIQDSLSAAGYEATELTAEALEADRAEVGEKITSFEIPVGNSASILRCGATATKSTPKQKSTGSLSGRNFAGVLELYMESLKQPSSSKNSKRSSLGSKSSSAKKAARPSGKPIIIVPSGMTSPITLLNSFEFFQNARFIPREVMVKKMTGAKPTSVTIKRNVSARLGGGEVEYEIIDNPIRKLQSPKDWDRVVAVVAQGAAWQFKGWKMMRGRTAGPVDIFSNAFGYYVGFEGAPVPTELQGWNVKRVSLSKDKRGLDSVVYAGFWNNLDEWMSVHKRGYLPE